MYVTHTHTYKKLYRDSEVCSCIHTHTYTLFFQSGVSFSEYEQMCKVQKRE